MPNESASSVRMGGVIDARSANLRGWFGSTPEEKISEKGWSRSEEGCS